MNRMLEPDRRQRQMARKWLAASESQRAITSAQSKIRHLEAAVLCLQHDMAKMERGEMGTEVLIALWRMPTSGGRLVVLNGRTTPAAASIDAFADLVAKKTGISKKDLYGMGRVPAVVEARRAAWALAYALSPLRISSMRLAKAYKRHHTTILHAVNTLWRRPEGREIALGIAYDLGRQEEFRMWLANRHRRGAA